MIGLANKLIFRLVSFMTYFPSVAARGCLGPCGLLRLCPGLVGKAQGPFGHAFQAEGKSKVLLPLQFSGGFLWVRHLKTLLKWKCYLRRSNALSHYQSLTPWQEGI